MNLRRVREMQDYSGSERSAAFAIRSACARAVIEAACAAMGFGLQAISSVTVFQLQTETLKGRLAASQQVDAHASVSPTARIPGGFCGDFPGWKTLATTPKGILPSMP